MKTIFATTFFFLMVGGAVPLALQDAPAAVVVKVEGTVMLDRAGTVRNAAVGDRLLLGDALVPAESSLAIVVHRSGASQRVTETMVIAPAAESESETMFTRTVRVIAQAATTDARSQPNRQGMIRPLPGQPALISPRNGLAVMDQRPTFTWFAVSGATGYRLQIRREGGAPIRFEVGKDTTFTLPEDAAALVAGRSYRWTVAPIGSGRAATEGSFRILEADAREDVQSDLALLHDIGLDPEGDGLFLAAVIYQEAGLTYEAARALDLLEASGAPIGAGGYLIRGEVLNALGNLAGASAAFDRADALTAANEATTQAPGAPSDADDASPGR